MPTISLLFRNLALAAAGTLIGATATLAADAGALTEAQARYRQDMAVCNSGQSNQDAVTCRREAQNALAEAKRNGLNRASPTEQQQNALRRCSVHQGDDRTDCEARMRGEGRVEGSAASGGVLRESETVVPGK